MTARITASTSAGFTSSTGRAIVPDDQTDCPRPWRVRSGAEPVEYLGGPLETAAGR